jgi:hypothetical protein
VYPLSAWYDGTQYIHVAAGTASTSITHYRFNTSTNLWTTGYGTATTVASTSRPIRVVARSDGDVLVAYTSSADTADLGYSRYEGSWTDGATAILAGSSGEGSTIADMVIDSTDIAAVWFYDVAGDDFTYRSINASNTVGTAVDLDTGVAVADTAHSAGAVYQIYDNSGIDTVDAAYLEDDNTISETVVALEAVSSSGQLGAEDAPEATGTNVGDRSPLSAARIGTTDYMLWWDDASSGTIYYNVRTAGTWGTRTAWKTGVSRPVQLLVIGTSLLAVYHVDATTVAVDWVVTGGTPATMTLTTATATAQAEAITFDAAAKLTGVTATATAQAEAVTLKGQGKLAVTAATATAQAEAVTFDAAAVFGATAATATAQAEAVNLAAAQAATLTVTAATATAEAEDVTLTGQGKLTVTAATATAQGEAVTFDAAAVFGATVATATATAEAVNLTGAVAASLAVTAATATAEAEDVTLAGMARLALTVATANSQAEAVTFDAAAFFGVEAATATSQAEGVSFDAAARMVLEAALASADANSVAMGAGASGLLSVTPATATAQAEDVTFDAAALFTIGTATASSAAGDVALLGAVSASLAASVATATAQAEGVDLRAAASASLSITAATANAAASAIILSGEVFDIPALEAVRIVTAGTIHSGGMIDSGVVPGGSRIVTSALSTHGGVRTPVGASGARIATIPATIRAGRVEELA